MVTFLCTHFYTVFMTLLIMQIFIMSIPGESKVLNEEISKYHGPLQSENPRILLLFKGSKPQGLSEGHSTQKQGRRLSSFWNKVAAGIIFTNRERGGMRRISPGWAKLHHSPEMAPRIMFTQWTWTLQRFSFPSNIFLMNYFNSAFLCLHIEIILRISGDLE